MDLNTTCKHNGIDSSTNGRVEALQCLLLDVAETAGLKDIVEHSLKTGKITLRPLELYLLQQALEREGYSRDFFVFD